MCGERKENVEKERDSVNRILFNEHRNISLEAMKTKKAL